MHCSGASCADKKPIVIAADAVKAFGADGGGVPDPAQVFGTEPYRLQLPRFFLLGNHFYVFHGGVLYECLSKPTAEVHWTQSMGSSGQSLKEGADITLKSVSHKVDFFSPTGVMYDPKAKSLTVVNNPTDGWEALEDGAAPEIVAAILDEYLVKIMDNKLPQLITFIINTIYQRVEKQNKMLLTGKSNKGKTLFFKLMQFVTMTTGEFTVALTKPESGWSQEKSKELMRVGLLLADEIADKLPVELKTVTDEFTL